MSGKPETGKTTTQVATFDPSIIYSDDWHVMLNIIASAGVGSCFFRSWTHLDEFKCEPSVLTVALPLESIHDLIAVEHVQQLGFMSMVTNQKSPLLFHFKTLPEYFAAISESIPLPSYLPSSIYVPCETHNLPIRYSLTEARDKVLKHFAEERKTRIKSDCLALDRQFRQMTLGYYGHYSIHYSMRQLELDRKADFNMLSPQVHARLSLVVVDNGRERLRSELLMSLVRLPFELATVICLYALDTNFVPSTRINELLTNPATYRWLVDTFSFTFNHSPTSTLTFGEHNDDNQCIGIINAVPCKRLKRSHCRKRLCDACCKKDNIHRAPDGFICDYERDHGSFHKEEKKRVFHSCQSLPFTAAKLPETLPPVIKPVINFQSFQSRRPLEPSPELSFAVTVMGYEVLTALSLIFQQWPWLIDEDQKEVFEQSLQLAITPEASPSLPKTTEPASVKYVPRFDIIWQEYDDSILRSTLGRTKQMSTEKKSQEKKSQSTVLNVKLVPSAASAKTHRQFIPLVFYSHATSATSHTTGPSATTATTATTPNILVDPECSIAPMIDQIIHRGCALLILPFGFKTPRDC